MVSFEVFIEIILPAALWRGVDSACNRNEYQEYFRGVKAAGAKNLTTTMSLKFLEPSRPVRASLGSVYLYLYCNTPVWKQKIVKYQ